MLLVDLQVYHVKERMMQTNVDFFLDVHGDEEVVLPPSDLLTLNGRHIERR